MNRTFSFRRQDLLNRLTLHDLLSIYPPLQDPEEVRKYCENSWLHYNCSLLLLVASL